MGAKGTATLNFGSAPGTNHVSVVVTGQAGIGAGSHVEAFLQGNDSTADHIAYEHMVLSRYVSLPISDIVVGTGFTINSITELRLNGLLSVRWVWD